MCNNQIILEIYYNKDDLTSYENLFESTTLGNSVTQNIDFGNIFTTYNNENIGNIQFNNINIETLTYPPLYNVTENISIQFNDGSAIFGVNYYKSNTQYYKENSKIIVPTTSCIGKYIGKSGYIVIDVKESLRYITIVLNS